MAVASRYVYTGFRIGVRRNSHDARRVDARDRVARHESVHRRSTSRPPGRCRGRFARAARREPSSPAVRRSSPPSVRASFTTERARASRRYAEAKSADSIARADVTVRLHAAVVRLACWEAAARATNYRANDSRVHDDVPARRGRAAASRTSGSSAAWCGATALCLAPAREFDTSYIAQHAARRDRIRRRRFAASSGDCFTPTSRRFGGTTRRRCIGRSIRRAASCTCGRTCSTGSRRRLRADGVGRSRVPVRRPFPVAHRRASRRSAPGYRTISLAARDPRV